ncbi:MAG: EVE domain-containing protein [Gammaproteobacteria bacterium]|nr:EVE domain-containing protein [Gammaproteobacteria bacterium]
MTQYWVMKTEPDEFGIDDLRRVEVESWDGVRNYQARNMMRDEMHKGDLAFLYHSACREIGIAGIMTIAREAYADPTALDPASDHFDPKSDPDNPRWLMVDVRYKRRLKRVIGLAELKRHPQLKDMPLLRKGNRLSVSPVTREQWDFILSLE